VAQLGKDDLPVFLKLHKKLEILESQMSMELLHQDTQTLVEHAKQPGCVKIYISIFSLALILG